ncbi:MAG: hypothetical protein Q7S63_01065 [bacterium]|nr:hypothetical protein [bacterium]
MKKRTTQNIVRSQTRKARVKAARKIADSSEATSLGVSVPELKHKKWGEVQVIVREQKAVPAKPAPQERWGFWPSPRY